MQTRKASLLIMAVLLALFIGVAILVAVPISRRLDAIEARYEVASQARSALDEKVSGDVSFHVDIPVESSLGGSISELEEYGQAFWRTLTPARKDIFEPSLLWQTPFLLEWVDSSPVDRDDSRSGDIDRQLNVTFFTHGDMSPADAQTLEKIKEEFAQHLRSKAKGALADNVMFDAKVAQQEDGSVEVEVTLKDRILWPGRIVYEDIVGKVRAGEGPVLVVKCRMLRNSVGSENVTTQTVTCDTTFTVKGSDCVVWIYGYPFEGQWIRSEPVPCR